MTAATNAERQAKHKAEQAALGFREVRGIIAHVDHHDAVRVVARKQVAKLQKPLDNRKNPVQSPAS